MIKIHTYSLFIVPIKYPFKTKIVSLGGEIMKTQYRWITIIILGVCILLLAACGTTQAAPTPTPTPAPLTPEDIIKQASQASKDTPMHMTMDMQMQMNIMEQDVSMNMKMDMDVNSTEEAQMTMALDMLGQTFNTEMIIVGGKVYVKAPGSSEWFVSDQSPSDAIASAEPIDLESFQDVTLVGEETIDGQPVYHLKAKLPFPESVTAQLGNLEGLMDIDYFVAKDTYLPVKMTGGGDLMIDVSGVETEMTFTMNAVFSDWGQEVEITAPIP